MVSNLSLILIGFLSYIHFYVLIYIYTHFIEISDIKRGIIDIYLKYLSVLLTLTILNHWRLDRGRRGSVRWPE